MLHRHSKVWTGFWGLLLAAAMLCSVSVGALAADDSVPAETAAEQTEVLTEDAAQQAEAAQANDAAENAAQPEEAAQPDAAAAQSAQEAEGRKGGNGNGNPGGGGTSGGDTANDNKDYSGKAAIYYLTNPANDPWTNSTSVWAPKDSNILATINTKGATWENGYKDDGEVLKDKNIKSNVASYITEWPDGSTGSTWTVSRDSTNETNKSYFTTILESIWTSYKATVEEQTGVKDLTMDDVTEITLTPRKISRDNGGTYPYHIDCSLSIACSKVFTAKFWVLEPGATEYKPVFGKNYAANSQVQEPDVTNEQVPQTKEFNGILYKFDGWYVEDSSKKPAEPSNEKVTFAHQPTKAQLEDGTVHYYAHYVPATTDLTVTKNVTGLMGDKTKEFTFTYNYMGADNQTVTDELTLSDGQSATIANVPIGATLTLTETNNDKYTTTVTYGGTKVEVTDGKTATITVAQGVTNIVVTNFRDVTPDTGITLTGAPYAAVLSLSVAGAAALLLRRRKRNG